MPSITSANSEFALVIPGLYNTPVRMQGYAADGAFGSESIDVGEVVMGIDGRLVGGFVRAPIKQTIQIQSDSPSSIVFEEWFSNEQANQLKLAAHATIVLPSIGRVYTLTNGFLTRYSPMPDAKKVLQPREFVITWQSVVGAST